MVPMDTRAQPTSRRDARAAAKATAGTTSPAHFLPHIQGLRAIAVLLVVVYHFWPGRLQGGYIGVDIFFVISGFLITGQLTRELERTGRIRLPSFYAKRARRLLPASILVLIFSAIATLVILPLSSLGENLREILASTFYVENWSLVVSSVDYLAASNDATTVQHYWSLSLEEQFYILWPLMLLGATALAIKFWSGRRWRALILVVAIATVLSLAFSIFYTQTSPAQAYFNTFTRAWEFGAGAILALLPRFRPRQAWLSNVVGYAGILTLLATGYLYDKATPFPGYAAILPVVGTMAIIVAHRRDNWWDAGRVLSWRPVAFIGDISYSLYLWHWPLIVIAPFVPGWGLSFVNRVALFLFCFLLAWLTKRFVEDPARSWTFLTSRKPRITFGFMLAAMALSCAFVLTTSVVQQPKYDAAASQLASTVADPPACFGAASGPTDGLAPIEPCVNPDLATELIPSAGFGNADRPSNPQCLVTLNDSTLFPCHFGSDDPSAPRVALIGDSHAYALLDSFIALAKQNGWNLTTYIKGGCPWTTTPLAARDAFAISCDQWRAHLTDELAKEKPFDIVFTAALTDRTVPNTADDEKISTAGYTEAWKQVLDEGTPIMTLVDNPSWEDDPNKCLRISASTSDCAEPRSEGLQKIDPIASAARAAKAAGSDVTLLDFSDTYCSSTECFAEVGGANVYRDQDHLTRTFASTLGPFIGSAMKDALARTSVK
jgi:peptidoglycan/LPS O-acetylase OafA/YrhL